MGFQLNQCQARQGAPKSLGCYRRAVHIFAAHPRW
jgi:hypothetical protein